MDLRKQQITFYSILLVGSLAAMAWGLKTAGIEGAMFGLFAAFTLGGGLMCIWERSVVRSAFSLMATFCGVAGLFVLLGHDFLAMAQILIYVGGILVLILFGVMLTPPDLNERQLPRVGLGVLLVVGALAFVGAKVAAVVDWAQAETLPPVGTKAEEIGAAFLTKFVVPFELAAVLLTVALVAAVYIARRKPSDMIDTREEGAY